jgi:hypothetical protein
VVEVSNLNSRVSMKGADRLKDLRSRKKAAHRTEKD